MTEFIALGALLTPPSAPAGAPEPSALSDAAKQRIYELELRAESAEVKLALRQADFALEFNARVAAEAQLAAVREPAQRLLVLWANLSSQEMYGEMLQDGMMADDYADWCQHLDALVEALAPSPGCGLGRCGTVTECQDCGRGPDHGPGAGGDK